MSKSKELLYTASESSISYSLKISARIVTITVRSENLSHLKILDITMSLFSDILKYF